MPSKKQPQYVQLRQVQLPGRQSGVVIIMALVILMILSILGISSMTSSTMEERMSSNVRDRHVAFQAAEAALRAGEREVQSGIFNTFEETDFFDLRNPDAGDVCKNGLCNCGDVTKSCIDDGTDYWSNTTVNAWNVSTRHRTYTISFAEVAEKPKYIIEFMGYVKPVGETNTYVPVLGDPEMFRITALGFGRTLSSRVMLQSTYKRTP